jgi:putative ATPase
VPNHLRDASYPGAKRFGHGKGYKYAHDYPGHFVEQVYGPPDKRFYYPTSQGYEAEIAERLKRLAEKRESGEQTSPDSS